MVKNIRIENETVQGIYIDTFSLFYASLFWSAFTGYEVMKNYLYFISFIALFVECTFKANESDNVCLWKSAFWPFIPRKSLQLKNWQSVGIVSILPWLA